jgi:hypothetical protein
MSFGWAPSEELLRQNGGGIVGGKKVDFFTRLEADRKCILLGELFIDVCSVKESRCSCPTPKPKRRTIPTLRDIITQELVGLMKAPPQLSGNLEIFLHGDYTILFLICDEVQRSILTTIEGETMCGKPISTTRVCCPSWRC